MDEAPSTEVAARQHETPADMAYELSWATLDEKQILSNMMKSLGRQRMNLQLMKEARFLVLKNANARIIGWAGLDIQYNPKYPEVFSLHLDSGYRHLGLGLLLETARAVFLLQHEVRWAYVRMSRDASEELFLKRLDSQCYTMVNRALIDKTYSDLCQRCELFNRSCNDQVFLKFDVEKFLFHTFDTVEGMAELTHPQRFLLRENKARPRSPLLPRFVPVWIK